MEAARGGIKAVEMSSSTSWRNALRKQLEEKPLPRTMPPEARRIIAELVAALAKHPEILLAIIHGGFTQRRFFRDIDVAVYTAGRISYRDEPYYTYTLSTHLSKLTGIPVNVKLLDYAPLGLRATILAKGQPQLISGLEKEHVTKAQTRHTANTTTQAILIK